MHAILIAAAVLSAALSAALAADPPKPADAPPAPAAAKGHLPPHFKALGLTADQKAAVEAVTGAAAAQVADMEKHIADVRTKEHADALAVLTADQRAQLKALLTAGVDDKAVTPANPPPTAPTKP